MNLASIIGTWVKCLCFEASTVPNAPSVDACKPTRTFYAGIAYNFVANFTINKRVRITSADTEMPHGVGSILAFAIACTNAKKQNEN